LPAKLQMFLPPLGQCQISANHEQSVNPSSINPSKGAEPTASGIKRGQTAYSSCLLCLCACTPFCTSKFLLGTSAHTRNPSYSEGRDQEDQDLKPARANSSQNPILKKLNTQAHTHTHTHTHTYTQRAGGVAQGVAPEFKPQVLQEKK
jgi:hypothetical protein